MDNQGISVSNNKRKKVHGSSSTCGDTSLSKVAFRRKETTKLRKISSLESIQESLNEIPNLKEGQIRDINSFKDKKKAKKSSVNEIDNDTAEIIDINESAISNSKHKQRKRHKTPNKEDTKDPQNGPLNMTTKTERAETTGCDTSAFSFHKSKKKKKKEILVEGEAELCSVKTKQKSKRKLVLLYENSNVSPQTDISTEHSQLDNIEEPKEHITIENGEMHNKTDEETVYFQKTKRKKNPKFINEIGFKNLETESLQFIKSDVKDNNCSFDESDYPFSNIKKKSKATRHRSVDEVSNLDLAKSFSGNNNDIIDSITFTIDNYALNSNKENTENNTDFESVVSDICNNQADGNACNTDTEKTPFESPSKPIYSKLSKKHKKKPSQVEEEDSAILKNGFLQGKIIDIPKEMLRQVEYPLDFPINQHKKHHAFINEEDFEGSTKDMLQLTKNTETRLMNCPDKPKKKHKKKNKLSRKTDINLSKCETVKLSNDSGEKSMAIENCTSPIRNHKHKILNYSGDILQPETPVSEKMKVKYNYTDETNKLNELRHSSVKSKKELTSMSDIIKRQLAISRNTLFTRNSDVDTQIKGNSDKPLTVVEKKDSDSKSSSVKLAKHRKKTHKKNLNDIESFTIHLIKKALRNAKASKNEVTKKSSFNRSNPKEELKKPPTINLMNDKVEFRDNSNKTVHFKTEKRKQVNNVDKIRKAILLKTQNSFCSTGNLSSQPQILVQRQVNSPENVSSTSTNSRTKNKKPHKHKSHLLNYKTTALIQRSPP